MLPPEARQTDVRRLVEQKLYFVLHAARQTGKTTLLQCLARDLNQEKKGYALYCTLESLRVITDPVESMRGVMDCLRTAVRMEPSLKGRPFPIPPTGTLGATALMEGLQDYCAALDRPLAILFDEVDALVEGPLLTFLSQLRAGYVGRATAPFPAAVALTGMRDLRDYRARVRADGSSMGGVSPFNVIVASLSLRNFTGEEISDLYGQHTLETRQVFEPGALKLVYEQTLGQPWLVNAIARECVEKILARDFSRPVTAALVEQAIEALILRRDTHIDSLIERLREPRVRRIVEPVLLGGEEILDPMQDDVRHVLDLGLLSAEDGPLRAANPIYREVIVRALNWPYQDALAQIPEPPASPLYMKDGRLDMGKLLAGFQSFWRENAEVWTERFEYKEAAPHLILMAFLQRVVNGGGRVLREYALGLRRMDLLVEYAGCRYPLEIKLHKGRKTLPEGLKQLAAYLDKVGEKEGWLVIFDRRPGVGWKKKLYRRAKILPGGRKAHIIGA